MGCLLSVLQMGWLQSSLVKQQELVELVVVVVQLQKVRMVVVLAELGGLELAFLLVLQPDDPVATNTEES